MCKPQICSAPTVGLRLNFEAPLFSFLRVRRESICAATGPTVMRMPFSGQMETLWASSSPGACGANGYRSRRESTISLRRERNAIASTDSFLILSVLPFPSPLLTRTSASRSATSSGDSNDIYLLYPILLIRGRSPAPSSFSWCFPPPVSVYRAHSNS